MASPVLDVVRSRRTVRRFTDEPVTDEDVEALLEGAMYAPSRLDRRPWHLLVLRNKVLQRDIASLLRVHPYVEQAGVLVLVCARPSLSPTWLMDVSAATENMLLVAVERGLGAAWLAAPDTALWNSLETLLRSRLGIPADIRVPCVVSVGHPAEVPAPHDRAERVDPLRIHYDRWEGVRPLDVVPVARTEVVSGG